MWNGYRTGEWDGVFHSTLWRVGFSHTTKQTASFIHLVNQSIIHPFIQSLVYSLIKTVIRSFSQSVIQSIIHLLINLFIHSCQLAGEPISPSINHSFFCSFNHFFIHSCSQSFSLSVSQSPIHSFTEQKKKDYVGDVWYGLDKQKSM